MGVTVVPQVDRNESFMQGLNQGISNGLSQLTQQLAQYREQGHLKKVMGEWKKDMSTEDKLMSLASAPVSSESKAFMGNVLLHMEDVKQKQEAARLKVEQTKWTPEKQDKLSTLLEKFGYDKEEAQRHSELFGTLTRGGQTEEAKMMLDKIMRDKSSEYADVSPTKAKAGEEWDGFEFPKIPMFQGLKRGEVVSLQKELSKQNKPDYDDIKSRTYTGKIMGAQLGQLERLNESGKLPSGAERWNINPKTGELLIPAASKNAETELFVKTVNDFTTKAKDSYGARVTNFELDRFMMRLPTLANSKEGRQLILKQMKIINDLDKLHNDSLKTVYNTYGLKNIDSQHAEEIAEQLRADKEDKLMNSFGDILSENQQTQPAQQQLQQKGYNQLPSPKEIPKEKYNVPLTDKQTGKKYITDGISWKEV